MDNLPNRDKRWEKLTKRDQKGLKKELEILKRHQKWTQNGHNCSETRKKDQKFN